MTSSFYAVLPSNSSMIEFPKNNQHTFKVKLPTTLPYFEGEWKVGLSEIQFPSTWKNVVGGTVTIRFDDSHPPVTFKLFDGVYSTISELINQIQKIFRNAQVDNDIVLHYDDIKNKVILKVLDRSVGFGISFSQNILNMLGLTKLPGNFYTVGIYEEGHSDITEGFTALYVYADVVQNRIVGDSMVPLLRVVPVERIAKKSYINWVRFHHIQYVAVNKTLQDTVEINIRRDNGDIVPFASGKVVLTLHFTRQ